MVVVALGEVGKDKVKSVELFAGAGGLAMGCTLAGFAHQAVVERDKHSCHTICENQRREVALVRDWPVHHMRVEDFDYTSVSGSVDLLAGGPPCQPFSIGGKHAAQLDQRDMFPQFLRAVRELRPRAFLVENVRGLLRRTFVNYFEYIMLQLQHPEVTLHPGETWSEHLTRLERHHNQGQEEGLSYRISFRLLNAADYGVPQKRERIFIVGFRADLGVDWTFPEATHSEEALFHRQWVTGEYWEYHHLPTSHRPIMPVRVGQLLEHKGSSLFATMSRPWVTVRDAIADLPSPDSVDAAKVLNHIPVPGARAYVGHTGSPLDEPAKTLKAGVHGVPGGENMLTLSDGTVRYFTVRESARLQSFPDEYFFPGCWGQSMRQIGNAVPVSLAHLLASSIKTCLPKN